MAKPKKDDKAKGGKKGETGVSTLIAPATKKAKAVEATQEAPASLNKEEFPKSKGVESGISKYMDKHSTNSITGHYLNELGVTADLTAGLTALTFGKYSLKRTHVTTDLWAIEDTSPSEE